MPSNDLSQNPAAAGCLSFFIPGLGQFINGEKGKAFGFFVGTFVAWFFAMGWVIQIWSVIDAYQVAQSNKNAMEFDLEEDPQLTADEDIWSGAAGGGQSRPSTGSNAGPLSTRSASTPSSRRQSASEPPPPQSDGPPTRPASNSSSPSSTSSSSSADSESWDDPDYGEELPSGSPDGVDEDDVNREDWW